MKMHEPGTLCRNISALERRLMVAESRPYQDWLILVENVPIWPEGMRPKEPENYPGMVEAAYGYVPPKGIPELREAIVAREAKVSESDLIGPDHVAVTAGGMNAIGIVLRYCFSLGYRKTVYATPTFRGVHEAIAAAGMSATALPLSHTEQDWDVLEKASAEPLVVYVNLPNNPTGAVATAGYLRMLERFAASHDVILLYDAIYDTFRFTEDSCPAPVDLAASRRNVIVVNSVSKNYARPGDRIGWILAHEKVIDDLAPQIEWEEVCISPRNQLAAAAAISEGNEALVNSVRTGREAYRVRTAGHELLGVPLPAGGTQLWLDLGVRDVEAMADFALSEHHVVLTTSANYAPTQPGLIRFPTGLPVHRMHAGLTRLERVIAEWAERQ